MLKCPDFDKTIYILKFVRGNGHCLNHLIGRKNFKFAQNFDRFQNLKEGGRECNSKVLVNMFLTIVSRSLWLPLSRILNLYIHQLFAFIYINHFRKFLQGNTLREIGRKKKRKTDFIRNWRSAKLMPDVARPSF